MLSIEKQSRLEADQTKNIEAIKKCLDILISKHDLKGVSDLVASLCHKRGLLKESIQQMFAFLHETASKLSDKDLMRDLLEIVSKNSDGKIFCEVERARVIKDLSKIYEDDGELTHAAKIMLALQVETYGSMDRVEKIGLFLEQVRLAILISDLEQAQIVAKKVNTKILEDLNYKVYASFLES